jgi:hypothetical protein
MPTLIVSQLEGNMSSRKKIAIFIILSVSLVLNVEAAKWEEKDCQKYLELIGGITWLSAETLQKSDKASKANKKEEAKEIFTFSLTLSQMAANHTAVYSQFCDRQD